MNVQHLLYLLVTSASIVACSTGTQNPTQIPDATEPAAIVTPAHEELVRNAVAQQLEVSANEIEIVSSISDEFSDSSLGCPQPGMMYAQVITQGYRTIVRHKNKDYDVRSAGTYVQICEQMNTKTQ